MKKTSFFALLFCLPFYLKAAIWYVATNGSDANPGSLSAPFLTLKAAIKAANPGDEIQLRGGNYLSDEIRINKSNLYIRSFPGEWAIVTAPVDDENVASCIWYNEPDVTGGTLERLEIVGGYYYGVSFETNWDWGLPIRKGVSDIILRQCKIHDTGRDCIKIKPACNGIQILSCELYNSGVGPSNTPANGGPNAEGIDNVNGDGMVVRHCYIHNISTSGVYVKGGAQNCIIEENLVYSVFEGGILLGFYTDAEFFDQDGTNPDFYECQYSVARNNIVYNTGGAGIAFFAARNCSAYHNTVVTGSGSFHAPLYFSPGEIWIDENTTLTPACFQIEAYNNIFIDQSGTGDEDYTVQVREGALAGTNVISYNLYHKTTGAARFHDGINWPAFSLSEWQTQTGFDANSMEDNPLIDNNLHLGINSPAIDAGRNSPALRDYDSFARTGAPDLGADEYNNGNALPTPPSGTIGTGASAANASPVREIPNDIQVEIFPNPACQEIRVASAFKMEPMLTLFDFQGRLVKETQGAVMTVAGLTDGIYFLRLLMGELTFNRPVIIVNTAK